MDEHLDVLEAIPGTVLNSLCIFLITSVTKKCTEYLLAWNKAFLNFLKYILTHQEKDDYRNCPKAESSVKPSGFPDTGLHVIVRILLFIHSQFHLHVTVVSVYLPSQAKAGVRQWFPTKLVFFEKERKWYKKYEWIIKFGHNILCMTNIREAFQHTLLCAQFCHRQMKTSQQIFPGF